MHRHPPEVFYANRKQVCRELIEASGLIHFGIDVGCGSMNTGLGPLPHESSKEEFTYHGSTVRHDVLGVDPVQVNLSLHLFRPFLRKHMTVPLFS
jgi:hypothetical protein